MANEATDKLTYDLISMLELSVEVSDTVFGMFKSTTLAIEYLHRDINVRTLG